MSPNWSYVATAFVFFVLGVLCGVIFFADDASAAAGLIRLTLGG